MTTFYTGLKTRVEQLIYLRTIFGSFSIDQHLSRRLNNFDRCLRFRNGGFLWDSYFRTLRVGIDLFPAFFRGVVVWRIRLREGFQGGDPTPAPTTGRVEPWGYTGRVQAACKVVGAVSDSRRVQPIVRRPGMLIAVTIRMLSKPKVPNISRDRVPPLR